MFARWEKLSLSCVFIRSLSGSWALTKFTTSDSINPWKLRGPGLVWHIQVFQIFVGQVQKATAFAG